MVDLTTISDRERWRAISGRAMVIVVGDRGGIRAGEPIEAIGQLARIPGPLNPGEFDYRGFLRGQGIDLRRPSTIRMGFSGIRRVGRRYSSTGCKGSVPGAEANWSIGSTRASSRWHPPSCSASVRG